MKVSLLASVIGAFAMNGSVLLATKAPKLPERDTTVIVELSAGLNGYTEEGVKRIQDSFMNSLRSTVTANVDLVSRYTLLNNAVAISVNSGDVEAIKKMPGVASVTVNTLHASKPLNNDETYYYAPKEALVVEENISATTMEKPSDTNDGEGTVIAILDNEFWLQGKVGSQEAWWHETFSPLDNDVAVRYTYENLTEVVKNTKGKRKSGTVAGEEGSSYLNNKVPYYYDYGGAKLNGSGRGDMDYDVHTDVDYHGSHVASIAAGNAPTYKGIAPKAQLACMKVFTEHKVDAIGTQLGQGTSTGAYDMAILDALEDCIRLDVDGINMSLGSDLDDFDSESITLRTLTKLCENGILTSISAGNSGKTSYSFVGGYGNWTTDMVETGILSSYANNTLVTTVASGTPDRIYYEHAIVINGHNVAYEDQIVNREGLDAEFKKEFKLEEIPSTIGKTTVEYIYIPGFGTGADYAGLDVDGKVAVVNRGSTSFASKYDAAVARGACGVIIVNNDPTASDFNFRCSFGDGFNPTVPCALVLFKDKPFFEANKEGSFTLISKEVSENDNKRTISTFSSDGARFDLELKPEITAPGDIIRGAVPPQKKEDKENTPLSTYQYLSGTSMSAPNHAGAQSVVLSKEAKAVYADGEATAEELADLRAYRNTVDMRIQSTAIPMLDTAENPETNVKNYTSPRLQGAGMVNLNGALNTEVYLEGYDVKGNLTKKSKISLRNNSDIAKGDIKLSFMAHNEGAADKAYNASVTVMRPAIVAANKIITKEYTYRGEVDNIEKLPGVTYWDPSAERKASTDGKGVDKYVYKVTKQIVFEVEEGQQVVMNPGYWTYDSSISGGFKYKELPSFDYQSTQDMVIKKVNLGSINIPVGDNRIDLATISLSAEEKQAILEAFGYGSYVEGYLELEATDGVSPKLGMPFLGYYSGSDVDASRSYADAPVVEPFSFDKSISEVYPSDLVNDVAKSLVGKDNGDMGSMMVAGYADEPQSINIDSVTKNDTNFAKLSGFHEVGTDPVSGEKVANPGENIYIGNPEKTNTLIVQQFVLRSVSDNYFTITNKANGKVAYKSALEDILYGEQGGKYPLYKSHVDGGFLSAGYIAHRAYAIIPLYDELTREAFEDGQYEIEFNYQLAATGGWISKSYTINIDSSTPEIQRESIKEYKADGVDRVRIEFKDMRLSYATIGYNRVDVNYDSAKKVYFIDEEKAFINDCIEEVGATKSGQKRLFITATDFAYGTSTIIIHFEDFNNFNSNVDMIEGKGFSVNIDFIVSETNVVTFIEIDNDGEETTVQLKATKTTIELNHKVDPVDPVDPADDGNKGCKCSAVASCAILATVASASLIMLFFIRRRKELGGK